MTSKLMNSKTRFQEILHKLQTLENVYPILSFLGSIVKIILRNQYENTSFIIIMWSRYYN